MDVLKAVFFAKEFGPIPVCSFTDEIAKFALVYRRHCIDMFDREYDEFALHWHPIHVHTHQPNVVYDCCKPMRYDKLSLVNTCLWNMSSLPDGCKLTFCNVAISFH